MGHCLVKARLDVTPAQNPQQSDEDGLALLTSLAARLPAKEDEDGHAPKTCLGAVHETERYLDAEERSDAFQPGRHQGRLGREFVRRGLSGHGTGTPFRGI